MQETKKKSNSINARKNYPIGTYKLPTYKTKDDNMSKRSLIESLTSYILAMDFSMSKPKLSIHQKHSLPKAQHVCSLSILLYSHCSYFYHQYQKSEISEFALELPTFSPFNNLIFKRNTITIVMNKKIKCINNIKVGMTNTIMCRRNGLIVGINNRSKCKRITKNNKVFKIQTNVRVEMMPK